jgi:tRNA modification GTPase
LIKRECAESLAAARTESVAAILMDQYRGALHAALSGLAVSLNDQDAPKARQQLRDLCQYRSLGLHLTEPWQVVLAGSPNVGKSSLINALVGFERAIVYDQPGTTRDIVTAQTVYNGWPIEFADTAGIRHASEPVEVAGVQQAVDRLQQSDLVVHVRDATSLDAADDRLTRLENVLTVINKVDQLPESNVDDLTNALLTSAVTGQGVEQLLAEIGRRLVSETPPPGTAVPFTARQYKELESVAASLENDDFVSASRYLTNVMGAAVVRS